jgi:hypothetical protein
MAAVTAERLAKALQVHRERIIVASNTSKAVEGGSAVAATLMDDEDRIIPRHDYDIASATADEGCLYSEGVQSHDVACIIETTLNEETGAYAQELFDILVGLSWSRRDILEDIPPATEIALRRRLRQLIVLLKGNDIWVYRTSVLRRLPERYTLAPADEPCSYQSRYVVALGPPGEYGETTLRVPIDHGQPFVLPAWRRFVEQANNASSARKPKEMECCG